MISRLAAATGAAVLAGFGTLGVGAISAGSAQAAPGVVTQDGMAPGAAALHGTFRLAHPSCAGGKPQGSYLSVTFGTKAIRNPQSSCAGGNFTLLSPGRQGLSTQAFSPASDLVFDRSGRPTADTIAQPVTFAGHELGFVTATDNLQDAPTGPAEFALPQVYLVNGKLAADLRSVQVLYDGPHNASCAEAAGQGCWLVGAERATGTYNPRTHTFTLQWFSGQSFTADSAGTVVHLAGTFVGAKKAVPRGRVVELGTQSFAAGTPGTTTTLPTAAKQGATKVGHVRHRRTTRARDVQGVSTQAASVRSAARVAAPFAITGAGTLIVLQLMALLEFGRKRRTG